MTIWLYCICRNEARLMPYVLRHYTTFVDRLEFFDDRSDDGTRELIAACPKAVLTDWPYESGIQDDKFLDFANRKWKDACGKADWIIWIDADEFIYHPRIRELLADYQQKGISMPLIAGYTMVSDHFPTTDGQIYDEIKTGVPDNRWCKPAVFRENMVWTVGRHGIDDHRFKPITSPTAEIKLLHYRCLGMDWLKERHARNWARVPDRCRSLAFGANTAPGYAGGHGVAWFQELYNQLPHLPNVI